MFESVDFKVPEGKNTDHFQIPFSPFTLRAEARGKGFSAFLSRILICFDFVFYVSFFPISSQSN
jgi:hypothetical protein